MKNGPFRDFVMDQLAGLGASARPMFGGWGLYKGADFFGILFKDRLYFKTGPATLPDYAERGMSPFSPSAKQTLKSYYEVPPEILDDPEELRAWARKAALQKKAKTSPPKPRKSKKNR